MASSTYRNAAYSQLRKIDQVLIDRIVEMGDDLSQPRHTLLFFYQPKSGRASFEAIASAAPTQFLTVSRLDGEALILEGQLKVDAASIKLLVDWALDRAEEGSATFDGWECAVVTPRH